MSDNINQNQKGYTLVELNLSIVVIGIILVGILSVFTNYFVQLTRNSTTLQMSTDSQNLLRIVTEEIRYGAGIRQNNLIPDPNQPAGWNTSNDQFVIITAVPAIDSSDQYIIDPNTGSPYINELVYYKLDDNIMYKRTLANPDAVGNSYTTSCPAASASPTCPADIQLIGNVQDMNYLLYDQDDTVTTDPLLARSVVINLFLERDTFGSPLELDNSIRTTLRNTF